MSIEQVARDFVSDMADERKTRSLLTPDAMVSGGVLPAPVPATEALGTMKALQTAFPDLRFDIQNVTVNGNQALVMARWEGTNKGPLSIPGLPSVPPTGKKVSVMDAYRITVKGDKVSRMDVESPANGGIPGALAQLGIKAPGI